MHYVCGINYVHQIQTIYLILYLQNYRIFLLFFLEHMIRSSIQRDFKAHQVLQ